MALDKIKVLLENLHVKEQELAELRTQTLEELHPFVKAYFLKKVRSTTDPDLRRDFASLSNTRTFTVNEDGTLTFTGLSYGTKVTHTVKVEDLLASA